MAQQGTTWDLIWRKDYIRINDEKMIKETEEKEKISIVEGIG